MVIENSENEIYVSLRDHDLNRAALLLHRHDDRDLDGEGWRASKASVQLSEVKASPLIILSRQRGSQARFL